VRREKVLALDYGTRNIGLAESDELGVTVRPLPSLPNRGRRDLVSRLRSRLSSAAVDRVVVGLPRNMDGTEGAAAARVRSLIGALERDLGLPVTGVDERLSTVEATEIWRTLSLRKQRGYRTVDSLAAALILERCLAGE
jgi:putative Holliday junction resolvase